MDIHRKFNDKSDRDLLTTSAWSALLMRRPGEDDAASDLPSTVDIDAIKSDQVTQPWPQKNPIHEKEKNTESEEETRSSSDSDSEESTSNSCSASSSNSSSRSSSCSSASAPSRIESPSGRQRFSVSKPDFDQGGLKLKISALKLGSNKGVVLSGTESDSMSSNSQERPINKKKLLKPATKTEAVDSKPKASSVKTAERPKLMLKDQERLNQNKFVKPKATPGANNNHSTAPKQESVKPKLLKRSSSREVQSKEKGGACKKGTNIPAAKSGSVENSKGSVFVKPSDKKEGETGQRKFSELSKLRSFRRKPLTGMANNKRLACNGGRYVRSSPAQAKTTQESDSSGSDEESTPTRKLKHDEASEITEIEKELGHISTSEPALPTMSEHLQVINQEDLAAILPDVVTTETHEGFDVFEDVASESGKADKKDSHDSGSDVELPEQVVSEAIKRIHSDSEEVDNSESDKDLVKSQRGTKTSKKAVESSSSDESSERAPGYSSSLLQQFVEKTELLSAQCDKLGTTRPKPKAALSSNSTTSSQKTRRKRRESSENGPLEVKKMPELEASYRLDCLSNVSPDSGIHSVPGSPVNETSHRDPTPPVLRPVSPPDKKRVRGRPKKRTSIPEQQNLEKRGPGRPKKVPPVLEPNPPIPLGMLNEICDKVKQRLELPKLSRDLQMKELERLIGDQKPGKSKSKFEVLFSKPKKEVAIVKPIIRVKEGEEDDERHNKRFKRIKKDFEDKFDELCAEGVDPLKKKLERDKKLIASCSRSPTRSRSRHLSSGTDCSREKSVDSDLMKPKKSSKAKKVALNNTNTKLQRKCLVHKKPHAIGLRHNLLHHKHKKRKEKRDVLRNDRRNPNRLWFVKELEKLISDFQKFSIAGKKVQPLSPTSAQLQASTTNWKFPTKSEKCTKSFEKVHKHEKLEKFVTQEKGEKHESPISKSEAVEKVEKPAGSEQRIRRIVKKRKIRDRERSRESKPCSDKDSGPDDAANQACAPTVANATLSNTREKEREKEKPKRKQKKNLEVTKGNESTETNPNEQRLPLKKRHYHLSSSSQMSPLAKVLSEHTEKENKSDSTTKPLNIATQLEYQNSVEDRFSSVSSSPVSVKSSDISISPSVIVTPKKRHKIDSGDEPDSKEESKALQISVDSHSVDGKKKQSLRCSSKDVKIESKLNELSKNGRKIEKGRGFREKAIRKSVEKVQTRSSTKPADLAANDPTKTEPLHIILPDEKVKAESIQNESPLVKVESPRGAANKPPAAGIFEPSETRMAVDNAILKPLTSPSEIVHLKESINVNRLQTNHKRLIKMAVDVKKKIRRRHRNRTGFPTLKKKKRKVQVNQKEAKTVEDEAVIEMERLEDNDVDDNDDTLATTYDREKEEKQMVAERNRFSDDFEDKGELSESSLSDVPLSRISDKSEIRGVKRKSQDSVSLEESGKEALKRKRKMENTVKISSLKSKSRSFLSLSQKKFTKRKHDQLISLSDESASDCADLLPEKTTKKVQPRWNKKYLTAGIFSECFKRPNCEGFLVPKPVEKSLHKLSYDPREHKNELLPTPPYCYHYLRSRRQDYLLPYDIWWMHVNNKLPGRNIVPSWNYKKIRSNVYGDIKPQTSTGSMNEVQACNCRLPPPNSSEIACGEDCINRLVFAECSPQLCPCKESCKNQRIQRHEVAPGLTKFMTEHKGWGIKTMKLIKTGDFILEYVGEVVSEKEFKERMATRYANDTHHYCLHLDGGLVIDGHRMGGDGRFVNHSCEPNCEMQKWSVNGLFRMALFALRDIHPDEELTYDYNFSLFNPVEGQVCKCGTSRCRGVIGGKSQRVPVPGKSIQIVEKKDKRLAARPRKCRRTRKPPTAPTPSPSDAPVPPSASPMSVQQRVFAQQHRCFLLRNIEKVTRSRGGGAGAAGGTTTSVETKAPTSVKEDEVFYTQMKALSTGREIKTRRLALAEDDPVVGKVARLARVFVSIYGTVVNEKDEKGELMSASFLVLPNKRKLPQYYTRIADPIDFTLIEQNINAGKYKTVEAFDEDMKRLFANNIKYYGRTSDLGISATRLKRAYNLAKFNASKQLEEILKEPLPASFLPQREDPGAEEEDVIRCLCGQYKDEGLMIQCERCLVWQHCDCVKADATWEHYLCERCESREVSYEIIMDPQPEYAEDGQVHYISLMREDVQFKIGDAVYVLRDMLEEGCNPESPPRKVTYKTAKNVNFADLDIFRIERLWIDKSGAKFAFGHHFLRPHETYHEPSRKFFINEVMRIPLYEIVPLDLIMQHCWVLDLNTFCKGRPVGAPENHVYICEYRVDRGARLFTKIAKPFPICTKNYAFERFDVRLRPTRTYTPHGNMAAPLMPASRSRSHSQRAISSSSSAGSSTSTCSNHGSKSGTSGVSGGHGMGGDGTCSDEELPLARVRDHAHKAKRESQKKRLNTILLKLLAKQPCKNPIDASYLVEPVKRSRSKKLSN